MTTSPVISQPYSYYNVLNPNNPLTDPLPAPDDSSTAAPSATTTSESSATADGSSNAQLSPDVMSLLQQILSDGGASSQSSVESLLSTDANPTSALLGGTSISTPNPLAGTPTGSVVQQVYASALEAANNATLQVASSADIGSQTVQSALAAYQAVIQAAHPNPTSTSA